MSSNCPIRLVWSWMRMCWKFWKSINWPLRNCRIRLGLGLILLAHQARFAMSPWLVSSLSSKISSRPMSYLRSLRLKSMLKPKPKQNPKPKPNNKQQNRLLKRKNYKLRPRPNKAKMYKTRTSQTPSDHWPVKSCQRWKTLAYKRFWEALQD